MHGGATWDCCTYKTCFEANILNQSYLSYDARLLKGNQIVILCEPHTRQNPTTFSPHKVMSRELPKVVVMQSWCHSRHAPMPILVRM